MLQPRRQLNVTWACPFCSAQFDERTLADNHTKQCEDRPHQDVILYMVGEVIDPLTRTWKYVGIFDSETEASNRVLSGRDFIVPVKLNTIDGFSGNNVWHAVELALQKVNT